MTKDLTILRTSEEDIRYGATGSAGATKDKWEDREETFGLGLSFYGFKIRIIVFYIFVTFFSCNVFLFLNFMSNYDLFKWNVL